MSKFLSFDHPREKELFFKTHADDSNNKERKYDPECGMSKEEFEWRHARFDRVSQRMPQALEKLNVQLQTMRRHFVDDPVALKKWDAYEKDVRYAYTRNLQQTLLSPLFIPNSILYEQLMKRRAQSKTLVGTISGTLDNLKQAAKRNKRLVGPGLIAAGVAAAFTLGLAVGRTPLRESKQQQQTDET